MSDTAEMMNGLVRRWWLLVVAIAVGAVAGFGYAALAAKVYTAQAYVIVTPTAADTGAAPDSQLAVNFADAYGRIIEQQDVTGPAAAAAEFHGSPTDFGRHIQASTSPDAPLIEIIASAGTAGQAAAYANATADSLVAFADLQTTETGVSLATLSHATAPTAPSSPQPLLDTLVGAAAGLLLGALATTVRRRGTHPAAAPATPQAALYRRPADAPPRTETATVSYGAAAPGPRSGPGRPGPAPGLAAQPARGVPTPTAEDLFYGAYDPYEVYDVPAADEDDGADEMPTLEVAAHDGDAAADGADAAPDRRGADRRAEEARAAGEGSAEGGGPREPGTAPVGAAADHPGMPSPLDGRAR